MGEERGGDARDRGVDGTLRKEDQGFGLRIAIDDCDGGLRLAMSAASPRRAVQSLIAILIRDPESQS
jgi:hypothetical protein